MKDQRLVYRVILKLLATLALLMLVWVFINSLFSQADNHREKQKKVDLIKIKLSDMTRGSIKKIHLGNKEVSILYRNQPIAFETLKIKLNKNNAIHPQDSDFYVYFNYGDSANCPLFYSKDRLKDTCSGKVFDTLGKQINNQNTGFQLNTPPHFFVGKTLFLGKWTKE